MKRFLSALALTLVAMTSFAQSITVLQPNGGEVLYGCQTYPIQWTSSGVSNYYNIDYSLDGGTIWSSVASNLNITNNQYLWTVPMFSSSTVYVRVRDYADTTKQDRSNNYFTIQLPITVTAPNGGEVWQGLSNHSITWNPAGTSGVFNLSYSINNGTSWISIASNVAANNYNWTVPNNPSTQALVRVQDATTNCQLDISNNVFTISAAQPILTAPNGGEVWTIASDRQITWNTATFHNSVKLEYSTNNGVSYNLIVGSTPNTGVYLWSIPNTPSTQVLVKASNVSGSTVTDVSNAVFTIAMPGDIITSANGGETWRSLDQHNITWDVNLMSPTVKLEYSINNGTSWNTITNSTTNIGSYTWTIPQMVSTTTALLRITSVAQPIVFDVSNAVFTIKAPVTVDYPNLTTDVLTGCASVNITWSRTSTFTNYNNLNGSPYANFYELYYSSDNGANWNYITQVLNTGSTSYSQNWTVPDVAPGNIKIVVHARRNSYQYSGSPVFWSDTSDFNVPVVQPSGTITVLNPNGGVTLNALTPYTITWTANGTSGFFDVLYSINGGTSWGSVANNITGTSYTWTVNNTPSTNVLIRVRDNQNICRRDNSNSANTIVAATPVLTSPNGGENWKVNSTQNITWNSTTMHGNVLIEFTGDNGANWNIVAASAPNSGSYAWTVPNYITTQAKIRISNVGTPSNFDMSNAVFTIQLPTPQLISPNGGETFRAGDTEAITWDAATVASNLTIEYSRNNGATWSTITTNAPNTGSYTWVPPSLQKTSNALVRITNNAFPGAVDTSNARFTILEPVGLTYPNLSTDTLTGCSTINISWGRTTSFTNYSNLNGSPYANFYELYYTSDNGANWNYITQILNTGSTGYSHQWTVPDLAPGNIKIAIVGRRNSYQYSGSPVFWSDTSDFNVPIKSPSGTIVVTNPNGGVTVNALTNYTVTWTANGSSGFFDVLYSQNGGTSWTQVANAVTGNSYTWNVNNTPTTSMRVRVRDDQNNCRRDDSNGNNTIIAATPVLTSPNGGENWKVNSTQNITWNTATVHTSLLIEFSADNGVNWNVITTAAPNTGSYAWLVPNYITTQAKVRISNVGTPANFDISNAVFTIQLPTPQLISPNGGETFRAGDTEAITWDANTVASNLTIEYSRNNGATWSTITSNAPNTGSYTWTPPSLQKTYNALVRITNNAFPGAVDTSNAVFTILEPVGLTYPNLSTDTLTGCSSINISWGRTTSFTNYNNLTGSPYANFYELYYTSDNGANWNYITQILNTGNTGYSHQWTVPDLAPGNIKIAVVGRRNSYQYSGSPVFWSDTSDFYVPIKSPSGTIVVTNPNGGVTVNALTNYTVTWTANGSSGFFDVLYSQNGGTSWTQVANAVTGNSYTWNVNNTPTTSMRVRVRDDQNNCRRDDSNGNNTIIAATPVLTSPNGGENWKVNSTQNITWNTATVHTSLLIEFSADNGVNWNVITTAAPNTGSYAWTVPNYITTQAKVRISNVGTPANFDISNAVFTIQLPTPQLISPNGGETFRAGDTEAITWDAATVASNLTIEYSRNNGATWSTITSNAPNTGSFTWVPPSLQKTYNALVRITNNAFPGAVDTSNAVFTILEPVGLTYPNLSTDTLTGCSTINIFWGRTTSFTNYNNLTGSPYANFYELYYTSDNGANWNYITQVLNTSTTGYAYQWTVPDLAPGNIKIAVVGRRNSYQYSGSPVFWSDTSDFYVPIKSPSGTIVVTNPNGGVTVNALTNYTVTWTANGSSGFFDVLYSQNGGTSWTQVANNITGNSYTWNVNNTPTTSMRVRVRDDQNNCRRDDSDANNTIIAAAPVLTSPNGGENWKVNSTQNITWAINTLHTNVYIEFSADNGVSWNVITAGTPNNGTYAWTVPNYVTSQALVRIRNVGPATNYDVSNAVFTIQLPTPQLISPNGGEVFRVGDTEAITWDANTVASNLTIEYSRNNGATWSTITSNAPNTGSYSWVPPSLQKTYNALVRITNNAFPSAVDTSNAVFTILERVGLTYPNLSTDTLTGCSAINIGWGRTTTFTNYSNLNGSPYANFYELYYTSDNGANWNYITQVLNTSSTGYAYQWTVPDLAPGNIKIAVVGRLNSYQYSGSPVFWSDTSDFNVPIKSPSGTIIVTTPNGGVTMNALTNYTVNWTANGTSGFFDVLYSTNGGTSWTQVANAVTGNSYTWNVNNTPSTNVRVRIRDDQNICRRDDSDASNTIIAATPVLTSPNGGEVWNVNSVQNITWTANTLYTSAFIEFSTDNGVSWNTVVTATPNTGTYAWTVPFTPSSQAMVRISNVGNPSLNDVSNAVFTIQIPTAVVTAPNGGETWYAGTTQNITWLANTFFSSTVNLEYSLDAGVTWVNIASNVTNNGTYAWTLPNVNSASALIRVVNSSNTSYFDVSNALLTLRPYVRLITPNGGNVLGACTQTTITFEKAPLYTSFNIEYSIDNGTNWVTLQSAQTYNNTINNYSWTLPNAPSTQALVRVTPVGVPSRADQSDATFQIRRAVTIIQPNFGGVLVVGQPYSIQWQSDGISNIYDLAYSTAGPSGPWTNIQLGYNTSTNTYSWNVPNTPSTNCYLRIRDNISPCKEDISDLAFTISTSPNPITVTSPNGSETLNACQTQNVTWTETGSPIGNYNISYSIDNGVNWIPVVSNYLTTSGSYPWTVPNVNSTSTLVRVQSGLNPLQFDLSNAAFRIIPGQLQTNQDTTICAGNFVQLNTIGGSSYSWTPSAGLSNPTIANPIATPSNTTQYIVTSSSAGCIISDTVLITVNPSSGLNASVSITPSPGTAVCAGSLVNFTASPINGGTNPSYQWKVNGSNVGTNTYTYSTASLVSGDVVSCVMTSSLQCVTNSPAISNAVTMTVLPNVTPTVAISTSQTTVCSGSTVTFTATATNPGGSPVYQWKKNGLNVGVNATTYTDNALNNNDIISLTLTSNASCASPLVVSSNSILMTVNANGTPTASITATSNNICAGTSVTFIATATNAGTTPTYQWKVNGSNVGTNSSTFTSSTLSNSDVVTCLVTSSATCNTISAVTSNAIVMTVSTSVVPSVTVAASSTNICAGQSITFTATPVNGGSNPSYQWRVNGINAGNNAATFTSSSLSNNDQVSVIMTSNFGCASPLTASSTSTTITVNPTTPPTVNVTASSTSICAGTNITFTANATNAGSMPSYQWKRNNVNIGGNAATFNSAAIANGDTVYCVVTSSSTCASPTVSSSNRVGIAVNPVVTPSVTIATTSNVVCANTSVLFTATPVNGGSNPSYQWKLNGNNVGVNASTYSTLTLNNNDVVSCVMTSNVACATTSTVSSNTITMTIGTAGAPTVSISATASTICSGTPITFSANVTNGGGSPSYQWRKNGVNISGATSSSYTSSTLVNNDAISCVVTSSEVCANPTQASSNAVVITVTPSVTPSISITASNTSICAGQSITFTAATTNAGSTPVYQWKVNGSNAGTNSPTFTSTTLANNDVVSCLLTSNVACATSSTSSSNALTITVNTTSTPTVNVTASASTICSGTSVTFTASVTNAGGSPGYQWRKNNVNISGAVSSTYTASNLLDNDVINCVVTSSSPCSSPASASSNAITMSVSSAVTPALVIAASTTTICTGQSVTFTATPSNGGSTPVYQWKVNGANAGTNSSTFSTTSLTNGAIVSCILTTNAACATSTTANSNSITITVNSASPSTVSISTSNTSVCAGTSVTFTATTTNAGTSPVYQWKVNGNNVGTNSSTFSSSTLANSDIVTCSFTSTSPCSGTSTVSSNSLTMTVNTLQAPSVSIVATSSSICAGQSVTFTATPTNGGASPVYQWTKNGAPVGTNASTYTSSTLANGDIIVCQLTSNATCLSASTASSNGITMVVGSNATPTITIATANTTICTGTTVNFTSTITNGGTSPVYQWKVNGTNVGSNSNTFSSASLQSGDVVTCQLTSSETCVSSPNATSNALSILVNPSVTPSVSISATATAICSGQSVTFTAAPVNGGASPSYQWKLNGGNVGTNTATYTNAGLASGDIITVVMTSSAACPTIATATATPITMTVGTAVTPTISIAATATTICAGTSVTFTATASNGGTSPAYQWKVNGTNAGTNSATFTSSTLVNNATVTCVLTSNASCATATSATSNSVVMTVSANVSPTITIATASNAICAGTPVTFTATVNNAGAAPGFQWRVNGVNQLGANSSTFNPSTLNNGDVIRCVVTSSAACINNATATSSAITMQVTPNVTPTVSVTASASTICSGTAVTFTASSTNGGTTPSYQWTVNGSNVGTNAATFSSSALSDGDVVNVALTSTATCVTNATAVGTPITMSVGTTTLPSVSISATATSICQGTLVTFTATPNNGGSSPSYQWKVNGINVGTSAASFASSTLADADIVSCELTSSNTCSGASAATSNSIVITVNANVTPTISITASNTSICPGSSVTFTATATNAGSAPLYQWKVNGNNAGTNSNTFIANNLSNNDIVTCQLTSNANCLNLTTVVSNAITITTTAPVTPTVSIASNNATICAGQTVTFTATPSNGGTSPSYQWLVNGSNAGTNNSTFSSSTLTNGSQVSVVMTSNATCISTNTATATPISITVNATVTPSVSISASTTSICQGTAITFTATPTNGGANPAYQWKVNGTNTGTNAATFVSSTLANNDVVTCVITSNATCLSSSTATSNSVTVTVTPNVTPTIAVTASANNICIGTTVTFTATITNGGTSPVYQWKVNGANVGSGLSTFISNTLANGDIVTCQLTSNASCLTTAIANATPVSMIVSSPVTPTVSIAANNTTICAGQSVAFTATPSNGGAAPSYQWLVNGNNAGTNSATFTSTTLTNGSQVSVIMTSNASCTSTNTATATPISVTVNSTVTPSVSISATTTSICQGTAVTFTATATNGGTNPAYQWKVNGTNTGTNSASFVSSTLANNDIVTCVLTSNASCTSSATATSNQVTMTVSANVTPTIAITASANNICLGTSVTFTATITNGGTAPVYQWKVNGSNVGAGLSTFTSNTLVNGDVVTCQLTSNAACLSSATVSSSPVTMVVSAPVTPTASITSSASTICAGQVVNFTATVSNAGTSPTYQWKVNGINVGTSALTYSSSTLGNGAVVTFVLTSNAACVSSTTVTSNAITITHSTAVTPSVSINTSNTAICQGSAVTFTASPVNGGTTPSYQWLVNGSNVGTNASTYTATNLNNNDVVSCIMTSNASCVSTANATSNSITMSVSAPVTPSITISTPFTAVCAGTTNTFTAVATNGGTSPSFQWQINGANVGTDAPTFATSSLNNGDVITCILTSNAACVSPATANSNAITMTVNQFTAAAVVLNASATSICSGTPVTFTALPSNAGINPTYNWLVNGVSVGASANVYTTDSLLNGSVVIVEMTTANLCGTPQVISSIPQTILVTPSSTPTVNVSTNVGSNTICSGTNVIFTAAATSGGSSPIYQWLLNGNTVGTNSPIYSNNALANNDVVSCLLTSNQTCVTSSSATSAPDTFVVNPSPTAPIATTNAPICEGTDLQLNTAQVPGATYVWNGPNGTSFNGNNVTIPAASTANSGNYTVVVSLNGCSTSSSVQAVAVNPVPAIPTITTNGEVLSSSSFANNQWMFSNTFIPGATNNTYTVNATGYYSVRVSNAFGCFSQSDSVFILITGVENIEAEPVVVFPNPAHSRVNIQLPQGLEIEEMNIIGADGKFLVGKHQLSFAQGTNTVDISDIPSGYYTISIVAEGQTFIAKLVVTK